VNILEVYTKKEYECKKCKAKIYYGKIADDEGRLYTTDGQPPNGKFGKESNVISGAVDALVQDRLHKCTEKFVYDAIEKAKGGSPGVQKTFSNIKTEWSNAELDEKGEEFKEGLKAFKNVAYHLAKEEHPELDDQTNLFGQIVNANTSHLIQLALIKAIKTKGGISDES
jgi:hypothetical protein